MKNTTRALRRHHRARLLQRAIKTYANFGWPSDPEHRLWKARRCLDNMKVCSCPMCCNVRSNGWVRGKERLTFAERRNLDSFNDQMEDLDFYDDLGDTIQIWQNEEQ